MQSFFLLAVVQDLVRNMKQLRHLALNQLLLDVEEVPGLLVAAAKHCTETLHSLELLNCSKVSSAVRHSAFPGTPQLLEGQ